MWRAIWLALSTCSPLITVQMPKLGGSLSACNMGCCKHPTTQPTTAQINIQPFKFPNNKQAHPPSPKSHPTTAHWPQVQMVAISRNPQNNRFATTAAARINAGLALGCVVGDVHAMRR